MRRPGSGVVDRSVVTRYDALVRIGATADLEGQNAQPLGQGWTLTAVRL
jgi:hypothetical protein